MKMSPEFAGLPKANFVSTSISSHVGVISRVMEAEISSRIGKCAHGVYNKTPVDGPPSEACSLCSSSFPAFFIRSPVIPPLGPAPDFLAPVSEPPIRGAAIPYKSATATAVEGSGHHSRKRRKQCTRKSAYARARS
jgi:hypothetical protein